MTKFLWFLGLLSLTEALEHLLCPALPLGPREPSYCLYAEDTKFIGWNLGLLKESTLKSCFWVPPATFKPCLVHPGELFPSQAVRILFSDLTGLLVFHCPNQPTWGRKDWLALLTTFSSYFVSTTPRPLWTVEQCVLFSLPADVPVHRPVPEPLPETWLQSGKNYHNWRL